MELDWLHDWIPALATFGKQSRRAYNNEEVTENMITKQNINQEWVSSYFLQLYGSI